MKVVFDPNVISYDQLLDHFFEEHNPSGYKPKVQYKPSDPPRPSRMPPRADQGHRGNLQRPHSVDPEGMVRRGRVPPEVHREADGEVVDLTRDYARAPRTDARGADATNEDADGRYERRRGETLARMRFPPRPSLDVVPASLTESSRTPSGRERAKYLELAMKVTNLRDANALRDARGNVSSMYRASATRMRHNESRRGETHQRRITRPRPQWFWVAGVIRERAGPSPAGWPPPRLSRPRHPPPRPPS